MIKRASLLRNDSVHGTFPGTIRVERKNNSLIVNGNEIVFIYANDPRKVDYKKYGIKKATVIDNTGVRRDEDSLMEHVKNPSVERVLLTAPG